jgi:Zn-dependent protease
MRGTQSINSGIQVGRAWGIPIYIHVSWFVIFILLAWSMAVGILPQAHYELSITALWLLGTVTSLLFAISVLLHELGHGYVALRNSIPVKNVTLFVFGGLAQISQEPPTAGVEFAIAIAGPLVSLALGLGFGAVWLLAPNLTYLAAPSEWLARINLSLLAFNMIPAFPLDGGRVLRAILWHFSKSQTSATRTTAITGEVIAFGLFGAGLHAIASGNLYNGLWLAFMGWFLQSASAAGLAEDVRPRRADVQNSLYRLSQAGYSENVLNRPDNLSNARLTGARQSMHAGRDSSAWSGGLPILAGVMPVLRHAGPKSPLGWAKPHWPWVKDQDSKPQSYAHSRYYFASRRHLAGQRHLACGRRSRRMGSGQRWLIASHSLQIRRGRFH